MNKYTLLKVVQKTLDVLGSDNVNSINDTEESLMITSYVEDTFYDWMSKDNVYLTVFSELESVSDLDRPNYLRLDNNSYGVKKIYYNKKEVKFIDPEDYIEIHFNDTFNADTEGLGFNYNRQPDLCTSFDEEHIVFNAVDGSVGSTLVGNKSKVLQKTIPEFIPIDDFIIPIQDNALTAFLAEVNRRSFLYLQGKSSFIDEENSKTGLYVKRRRKIFDIKTKGRKNWGRK